MPALLLASQFLTVALPLCGRGGGRENGRVGVWEGESEGGVKGGDVEEMRKGGRDEETERGEEGGNKEKMRQKMIMFVVYLLLVLL